MKPLFDLTEKRELTRKIIFLALVDQMETAMETGIIKTIRMSEWTEPQERKR